MEFGPGSAVGRLVAMLVVLALSLPGSWAVAQEESGDAPKVSVSLVSEFDAVRPGERAWLGIRLRIAPGWHVYWDGQNDSGVALEAKWSQDELARVGKLVWPAPRRHVVADFILDHVYEREVLVLVPVHVSKKAVEGDLIEIEGRLNWMVCEDICLLEEGGVSIRLPVAATDATLERSEAGELFLRARKRIPVPDAALPRGVGAEVVGSRLRVRAAGADYLAFYPENECSTAVDLIAEGESRSGELVVRFEGSGPVSVRGLVEVRREDEIKILRIAIPPEETDEAGPTVGPDHDQKKPDDPDGSQ